MPDAPRPRSRLLIVGLGLLLIGAIGGGVGLVIASTADPCLEVDGPDDGALLGADDVADGAIVFRADEDAARGLTVTAVGEGELTDDLEPHEEGRILPLSTLPDGEHELVARLSCAFSPDTTRLAFTIDTVPPEIDLDDVDGPLIGDEPLEVTGRVDDAEAEVSADAGTLEQDGETFTLTVPTPVEGPVTVTAVDAAGNRSEAVLEPIASVPSRVTVSPVRSVHVSFWGWVTGDLRDPVLEMAEDGLINAVQLDLKDESGVVGYDSEVDRAHEIGAVEAIYDLDEAVAELHDLGLAVIGRIVAFRDPVLAAHAWEHDEREQVIQTDDGEPYGGYGGFTNFADDDVVDYNVALAVEAARAGVDDILWDYVRRPDGDVDGFRFPGLEDSPEQAVVDFVAEADETLAPYGVSHGASVYGIAVDRPTQIAQDIAGLAEHTDYIAPMVYPSHWGPGEYDVASPIDEPYDIVAASLADFVALTEGQRARIIPWLQDFSIGGVTYDAEKVRAQIDATYDTGLEEWILWSPGVRYTTEAIDPLD